MYSEAGLHFMILLAIHKGIKQFKKYYHEIINISDQSTFFPCLIRTG